MATLQSSRFAGDPVLEACLNGLHRMLAPETGEAVKKVQRALRDLGFPLPLSFATGDADGQYGNETAQAVSAFKRKNGIEPSDGVVGPKTMAALDSLFRTFPPSPPPTPPLVIPMFGKALAELDKPLATSKARAAVSAIQRQETDLATQLAGASIQFDPVILQALNIHFRLLPPGPASGNRRGMTPADLALIRNTYLAILNVYNNSAVSFEDGIPVNGVQIAAEAPLNGPIRFGPAFRNFNAPDGAAIGPNSRAAILIHEATHVVDGASGQTAIHISEFDPTYDAQSTDNSLHNPSSYAGFAAHIFNGADPNPRFGLGAGRPF
jgi:peptidoglycan hydrolase-like protein with peptidoglycan-binding domain